MANRFFVAGGVDNNWGTTGNWSTTSGGGGGSAVPLATDDVFLDGNSPNCTINTSARVALTFTTTGYTNTLTFSQTLTVSGAINLSATTVLAGASALIKNAVGNLTSNGLALTVPLTLQGNVTHTLVDNWNVDALLTVGGTTTQTINGNQFNVGASFTATGGGLISGTTKIVFDGTGTWSGAASTFLSITGGVQVNTAGTLTISGTVTYQNGTFTYTAGTVVTTGSRLRVGNLATILAVSGITFNEFAFGDSSGAYNVTSTLNEDVNCATLVFDTSTTGTVNGNQINITGGINGSTSSGSLVGTTEFVLIGTGTLSWVGDLHNPITINTAGTITLSGSLGYNGGPLVYTAGTVVGGAGVTLLIQSHTGAVATTTFNLNGLVLDANLTLNRTGATAMNLTLSSGMEIVTGRTVRLTGASGSQMSAILSSSGGTQRKFTLQAGVLMNIRNNTATDMDSGDGQAVIWRKPGTISNTINWGETAGGSGGGNPGGGGVNPISASGARFYNIGNAGVKILSNS